MRTELQSNSLAFAEQRFPLNNTFRRPDSQIVNCLAAGIYAAIEAGITPPKVAQRLPIAGSHSVDGRVAPGSCTPRPSRPGESHPEALTDPCLSLSAHTARVIHGELALSVTTRRFLPLPVDQSGYDANDPPPSLHGHYSTS